MHRIHSGFGAKTDDARQHSGVENRLGSGVFSGIHKSAIYKYTGIRREMVDEENGQKAHHRARHGVEQILEAGSDRLFCPLMQYQRHGSQRQKLKAEVHGDKVSLKALRDERPHGDQEKRVESRDPLLHLHVFKGIEQDCGV